MKDNIILDIFNKSFCDYPLIVENLTPLLIKKMDELKIDVQDLSLLETISSSELNEIINRIQLNNKSLCEKKDFSGLSNIKTREKLINNFFEEIYNSIDLIYNLIISKQLGG